MKRPKIHQRRTMIITDRRGKPNICSAFVDIARAFGIADLLDLALGHQFLHCFLYGVYADVPEGHMYLFQGHRRRALHQDVLDGLLPPDALSVDYGEPGVDIDEAFEQGPEEVSDEREVGPSVLLPPCGRFLQRIIVIRFRERNVLVHRNVPAYVDALFVQKEHSEEPGGPAVAVQERMDA